MFTKDTRKEKAVEKTTEQLRAESKERLWAELKADDVKTRKAGAKWIGVLVVVSVLVHAVLPMLL